jgi:hypothetical protein
MMHPRHSSKATITLTKVRRAIVKKGHITDKRTTLTSGEEGMTRSHHVLHSSSMRELGELNQLKRRLLSRPRSICRGCSLIQTRLLIRKRNTIRGERRQGSNRSHLIQLLHVRIIPVKERLLTGIGCQLDARSLDLRRWRRIVSLEFQVFHIRKEDVESICTNLVPFHPHSQIWPSSKKEFMVVSSAI